MTFSACGSIRLAASRVASAAVGSTILLSLCERLSSGNHEGKEIQHHVKFWNSVHAASTCSHNPTLSFTTLCASGDGQDGEDNDSNESESYLERHLGRSAYQEVASLNALQQNARQQQTTPSLTTANTSSEPQANDGESYLEKSLGTEAYKEVMALNALQSPRQQVPSPAPEDASSDQQGDGDGTGPRSGGSPLSLGSKRTSCEERYQQANVDKDVDDSYPNFSRHGNASYLKKYLTPQVYKKLHDKKTLSGVTLEDIIQCGVALPLGADPPRGIGVYAGDAECYTVFAPLLDPMIAEYHGTQQSESSMRLALRRHSTNLDPEMVLSQRPDPTGEYILYTRMRVARSIEGFVFSPSISRSDRRKLQSLVQDCVEDWKNDNGKYVPVYHMSNTEHNDLIRRHILFHDPDEWAISAGFSRDWPDARGIYCNEWERTPTVMIWCNAEDHVRVISMRKGGDLHGVFTSLSQTVQAMESSLQKRGHKFVYDERLGYLNTCPTNLGTALRASVFVKLVRLGRKPWFKDLVKRLKLQVTTKYGDTDRRYTGIFDVSNAERLGKSEVQLLNIMIQGVGRLIELEKRLEKGESVNLNEIEF